MAHRKGIKTDFVKTEQPTITKARIIGGRQQIVRIDYEQHLELSEKAREDFQIHLASLFQEFPTLVISDYGKGMIFGSIMFVFDKNGKITIEPGVSFGPERAKLEEIYRGRT